MKIRFKAEFARDWVMTREATMGKNPVNHLRDCIQKIIGPEGHIKILDSGYTNCNLVITTDSLTYEGFEVKLWQALEDEFQIGKGSREADIRYDRVMDEEEKEEAERARMLSAIKLQEDSLQGATEFKALLEEMRLIAPQIAQLGVQRVFNAQAYLFSLDEGCGYTTYLNIMANLIGSLGLFDFADEGVRIIENVVEKNDKDPWLQFGGMVKDKFKGRLISFDISQWVDSLDDPMFRRFLRKLRSIQKDYIYVFRVPYFKDDLMLDRVYQDVSDAMFTRKIVFEPFTYKDYFLYAARPLASYNFQVADDARDEFNKKVMAERSKGSFYGLRSIRKIVYEMMYRKVLHNARTGSSSQIIHAEDLAGWAD